MHNLGQILVAMILLETVSLAWYLLILWFTGIASGFVIGLIGGELCKRLEKIPLAGENL
jgi:heptaprenyl diphosphate synthase